MPAHKGITTLVLSMLLGASAQAESPPNAWDFWNTENRPKSWDSFWMRHECRQSCITKIRPTYPTPKEYVITADYCHDKCAEMAFNPPAPLQVPVCVPQTPITEKTTPTHEVS